MGGCFSCRSRKDRTRSFPCAPPATRRTYSGIYQEKEVSERLNEVTEEAVSSRNSSKLNGELSGMDVREWLVNLDLPLIKARAMALEHGLNTILLPILDCVEQLLTKGCQLGSCMATWETARISHLPRLVEAACQGNTQLGSLAQLREATSGMLRVLHAMSVAGEKAQIPVPPVLLEISSLNRLMGIASRIVGRSLAHETQEAAAARWREWHSTANALGLTPQHLAIALSAGSKAFMTFMHMSARFGSGRVAFKVTEATAFTDSLKQALLMGLLDQTCGGMVVYPTFSRCGNSQDESSKESSTKEASGAPANPRQHFFERAGQQMVQDEKPEASGRESKAESTALFLRRPSTGRLWFNTRLIRSSKYLRQYRWAGWLLGQCFANRTSLHIPFPELLFEKLLQGSDFTATVEALSEFDAEKAGDVRGVLGMKREEYKALARSEGFAEDLQKRVLMRLWVKKMLVDDVSWQYKAFSQGFYTAVDRETLKCWRMTAANLAELAAGPQLPSPRYTKWKRPSVEELRAAQRLSETAAEHIATSNAPIVNTLWKAQGNGDRREVMIQAQASFRTISGLMSKGSAPATIFV